MGKRLHQQRRGRGTNKYKKKPGTFDIAPSFKGIDGKTYGEVIDIIHHTGHTAPLMKVRLQDSKEIYLIAPEGIKTGDRIVINGDQEDASLGSVLELSKIPAGSFIYNIERIRGDGGTLVRSAGSTASIVSQTENTVTLALPSKKLITVSSRCRAQIGLVAGGGRYDMPFMKAGRKYYRMRALNRLWPKVRAVKMNAADHPFGGKTGDKRKPHMSKRNAPPGRKAGMIAPRRTGRRKK
ncbi:MAG: 50S ribosomal protein L2 [Candidatus Micrarchaeota archaeon]|nr:MAG: 50S ribosomal protein L2 [Candidatus Micrarchaeota archaeon]